MNEDRAKREINVIAKLLNAENSGRTLNFSEAVNALYETIRTDFRPALEGSSVKDKDRIYSDILESVDDMEIFCNVPELLGKSFVGIFGFDEKLSVKFIASALTTSAAEQANSDTNVPAIFIGGKAGITAVNDTGNPSELSGLEYSDTNCSLWRRGIDIRNFLRFYIVKGDMKFKNIAFVYFPAHVNVETVLLKKLDAAIVCGANYENHKNKLLVREVRKARNIPVKIIADESGVSACDVGNFDVARRNSLFTDRIRSTLLEIKSFYDSEMSRLQDDRNRTASDLVNITLNETREAVTQLSNDVRNRLNELEQGKKKLDSASIILMDKAKIFESEMDKKISGSIYCESTKEVWQKIFLHAVDSKDIQLAAEYLGNFQRSGEMFKYYIYSMLFMYARGERPHHQDLEKLRYSPDNELVLKAKLRLRQELNFSDENCMGIASVIKSLETPEEFYYRAMHCESQGDRKQAEIFYRRSLNMGYVPAGTKLFRLAGSDRKTLKILADQMIPEANFALGEIARSERKFLSANRYFKLAAAREYLPAVKILADEAYFLFNRDGEPDARKAERAIRLYSYIMSREPDNAEVKEKIGDIYRRLNDDRRALGYWEQCKTQTAFYKMGRLYMYQYAAFGQDLDVAESYLKKAPDIYKARECLHKISMWKAQDEQKKQAERERRSRESYSSRTVSHSYSSSSSSGCFVITAANSSLNVLDRWAFKRLLSWKNKLKNDSPLIAGLLEDYERFAPVIVNQINKDKNSVGVYQKLWSDSISKVYEFVCQKKFYDAAKLYAEMMKKLCFRYSLKIPEETQKNLELVCSSM